MPTWIKNLKESIYQALPENYQNVYLATLSEMQVLSYNIVQSHYNDLFPNIEPLALIIIGEGGTGKSYLINAIHTLLRAKCAVTATTGKAAFNLNGVKVQSLLKLQAGSRGNKDLAVQSLIRLQESLSGIDYIIIDKYSMLGQTIDRRCKQASG